MIFVGILLFALSLGGFGGTFISAINDPTLDDLGRMFIQNALGMGAGALLIVFGALRKKSKKVNDTLQNLTKLRECPNCKTNLKNDVSTCPVCGTEMEGR